jgi:hypothetical protein
VFLIIKNEILNIKTIKRNEYINFKFEISNKETIINKKNMESDDDDRRFAGEGGEALELDGEYDSEEEEVEDDEEEDMQPPRKPQPNPTQQPKPTPQQQQPQKKGGSPAGKGDVKG